MSSITEESYETYESLDTHLDVTLPFNESSSLRKLPQLPAKRYQYSVWHDLSTTYATGPELKAPRVRDGPKWKDDTYYIVADESGRKIHHGKVGRERRDHRNDVEDWENIEICNLSHQELQHNYQQDNLLRILKRLKNATEINIQDNLLADLSNIKFPKCQQLNLSYNNIEKFSYLPSMPEIRHLNISYNHINSLQGTVWLRFSNIVSLIIKGNPIEFTTFNVRGKLFAAMPSLKLINGIPRTDEDILEIERERVCKCIVQ